MKWVAIALVLALPGCIVPEAAPEEGQDDPADGAECDYELDDYAGGTPHLMVHWDLDGHEPRVPSGIEILVTVYDEAEPVRQGTTTTDCILFDMAGVDADHVIAKQTGADGCRWVGSSPHAYEGDFESVKVPMQRTCS